MMRSRTGHASIRIHNTDGGNEKAALRASHNRCPLQWKPKHLNRYEDEGPPTPPPWFVHKPCMHGGATHRNASTPRWWSRQLSSQRTTDM